MQIFTEKAISENQRDQREKNIKNCFPQITQIDAEKESAKISEISGREKRRKFPADNAG